MTDPTSNSEDLLKKLSRRRLLRDTAITATGAVLLPSLLTGCHKDVYDLVKKHIPKGGLGSEEPLTTDQLKDAADNLRRMRAWVIDVYTLTLEYDEGVFKALSATPEREDWKTIVLNVFTEIGIAVFAASEMHFAAAALALTADFVKEWGLGGERPDNLRNEFATFQFGHNAMQAAIEQRLSHLVDPTNNYSNLRAAWTGDIEFNGKTYQLHDLALSNFPDLGDDYNLMQNRALIQFKKSVWNLIIMKCCKLYRHYPYTIYKRALGYPTAVEYAQKDFYSNPLYAGSYLRGFFSPDPTGWGSDMYRFTYWDLGINGNPFPPAAIEQLFIDDTPGHIINSQGLFPRSYVFQQFHITKPDFSTYGHELAKMVDYNGEKIYVWDFDERDDWTFTGGMFPQLTKPE